MIIEIIEEQIPYPYSLLKNPQSRKDKNVSQSVSNNFRLRGELAEVEAPEDYFIKEVKINKDEYERFKNNFH